MEGEGRGRGGGKVGGREGERNKREEGAGREMEAKKVD